MATLSKQEATKRAHLRIRKKIKGSEERPRLATHKSGKNIYAQVIDDSKGITLVSASSLDPEFKAESTKDKLTHGGSIEAAQLVGKLIGEKALKKNIKQVVFDRGGHLYHGRIEALAEAARESGLEF
ncbi:MAG: 50S ribosomal protein L18 [Candidatus Melainabacteria bacterium]|jgi:large subunit ribosomal protein L18